MQMLLANNTRTLHITAPNGNDGLHKLLHKAQSYMHFAKKNNNDGLFGVGARGWISTTQKYQNNENKEQSNNRKVHKCVFVPNYSTKEGREKEILKTIRSD